MAAAERWLARFPVTACDPAASSSRTEARLTSPEAARRATCGSKGRKHPGLPTCSRPTALMYGSPLTVTGLDAAAVADLARNRWLRELELLGASPARPQPDLRSAARQSPKNMPVVVRPTGEQPMLARNGLQLPQRLPFERWLHIGTQLSALSTSAAWCLGDWLVFGEQAYAGRYRQAIERTSLDYQTLRNYAWVAKRFSLARRRDKLSFGHHCEVAALPEPEQDFWLRKAEEHHWPVKQLRREVRASLAERSAGNHEQATEGEGQHAWVLLKLQIRLSPGQLEAWQVAADKASLSVQDWAAQALQYASDPATGLQSESETAPLGIVAGRHIDDDQVAAQQGVDDAADGVAGQATVEGLGQLGGGEVAILPSPAGQGAGSGNVRNGTRPKTGLTNSTGQVEGPSELLPRRDPPGRRVRRPGADVDKRRYFAGAWCL